MWMVLKKEIEEIMYHHYRQTDYKVYTYVCNKYNSPLVLSTSMCLLQIYVCEKKQNRTESTDEEESMFNAQLEFHLNWHFTL